MPKQTTAKQSGSRFKFVGEIITELKKVVWLTRREIIYLTFLVLVVSIAFAIVLGLIDYGFANLVNKAFLGG